MTEAHDSPPATFESLGLSLRALEAVAHAGFASPTPIQALAIPPALAGRDVIGCAATGTGKTAAFVLPMIERLVGRRGTRALILAPTRELALQIGTEIRRLGARRGFGATAVVGGLSFSAQVQEFRYGRSAIVATPGRLVDHLERRTVRLDQVECLVLDEADRMLDMGFAPQLERILAALPARDGRPRQTLLFSATMAGEVAKFASSHLVDPVRVAANPSGTAAPRVEQCVYLVPQGEKTALLLALLARDDASTLVFARTKRRADRLAEALVRAGHAAACIHADRSQLQRRQALQGFSRGHYRILVATDIAARGIDVADIGHVVNFDLPFVAEDYVHRIGRTARAAKSGRASSFVSSEDLGALRAIERLLRGPVRRGELPAGIRAETVREAAVHRPGSVRPQPGKHAGIGSKHGRQHPTGPGPGRENPGRRQVQPGPSDGRRPDWERPAQGRPSTRWAPRDDTSGSPIRHPQSGASRIDGRLGQSGDAGARSGYPDRASRWPARGGSARMDRPSAAAPPGRPADRPRQMPAPHPPVRVRGEGRSSPKDRRFPPRPSSTAAAAAGKPASPARPPPLRTAESGKPRRDDRPGRPTGRSGERGPASPQIWRNPAHPGGQKPAPATDRARSGTNPTRVMSPRPGTWRPRGQR